MEESIRFWAREVSISGQWFIRSVHSYYLLRVRILRRGTFAFGRWLFVGFYIYFWEGHEDRWI
jgi:hypothetical protein